MVIDPLFIPLVY